MEIGVLHLPRSSGKLLPETERLREEIEKQGHKPVLINYFRTASKISDDGISLNRVNLLIRLSTLFMTNHS